MGTNEVIISDVLSTTIDETNGDDRLHTYPDPADDAFTIELPAAATLEVFDATGRRMWTDRSAIDRRLVDVSLWKSGIYLAKARVGAQDKLVRVVVAH